MASLRLLLCAALVPTVAALWPLPDRRSVMDGMNTYFQSTTTLANGVAEPMQEEGFYCYGGGAGASSTSAVERVAHSLLLPFTSVRFVVSGKGLMTKVYSRDTNDFGEWLVNAHDTLEATKASVSGRREQRGEATCTVEQLVLQEYKYNGGWSGMHVEAANAALEWDDQRAARRARAAPNPWSGAQPLQPPPACGCRALSRRRHAARGSP